MIEASRQGDRVVLRSDRATGLTDSLTVTEARALANDLLRCADSEVRVDVETGKSEPDVVLLADLTSLREGLLSSSRAARTTETKDRLANKAAGIAISVEAIQQRAEG